MYDGPSIARVAALIGDHARAHMLTSLLSGEALTATELAQEAGVTPQTVSTHLAKLVDARLLTVERQGRHRYFRLAGADVVTAPAEGGVDAIEEAVRSARPRALVVSYPHNPTTAVATPEDLRAAPGTVGRPSFRLTIRILDEDGNEVPAGGTGEVYTGGGLRFAGYTGGGGKRVRDGLTGTGDLGHLDAEGRLFIDGRADDMIVSGGENVFPGEVEDLLGRHPAVAEVTVKGVEDERFGQRLAAYVVRREDSQVTEDDLPVLRGMLGSREVREPFQWFGWSDPGRTARTFAENGLLGPDNSTLMVAAGDETLGFVSWRRIEVVGSYFWNMGILLLPAARGRGVGTRAQQLLVRYLFAHTPVVRIEADTDRENIPEQRALEKAGFTREGMMRSVVFRDGRGITPDNREKRQQSNRSDATPDHPQPAGTAHGDPVPRPPI